jgi:D-glycero-alpha-D-manno-heptose-7-phosphate kinase
VTDNTIDNLYDLCIDNGAIGGKLLGSGGGGFMLFYVPYDKREEFLTKLPSEYKSRVVNFSFTHEGSKIIYNDKGAK